jgi:hypothetical protein
MMARLKFYGLAALAAGLAVACAYLYFFRAPPVGETRLTVDAPALLREIQQLSELVTVKYGLQKVVGLTEEKVPFGSEALLLLVQADVLAGVDLAQLTPNDVQISPTSAVTIRLPAARILRVYIDDKHTRVWDRKKTWWTPWVSYNPELDQKARRIALEHVQAAALEMGILGDAQNNARRAIRNFLHLVGVREVQFQEPSS